MEEKKILGKGDGKLVHELIKQAGIKADYNEQEKEILVDHYNKGEMNQFYLFIVQKVLTLKNFTLNNHNVITGLTAILSKIPLEKLQIVSDNDVIKLSNNMFQILMIIDVEEIYKNEF